MLVLICFCSGFAGKFTFLSIYFINISYKYQYMNINNIINIKNLIKKSFFLNQRGHNSLALGSVFNIILCELFSLKSEFKSSSI